LAGWLIALAARALPARLWGEETERAPLLPALTLAPLLTAMAASLLPAPLAPVGALLGWVLLLASLIDLRHFALPDALTLPLIPAGLGVVFLTDRTALADHVIGAFAGYAVFAAIAALYRRFRGREGLGMGDAKLLAASGAWVGWAELPWVVLLAACAALLTALLGRRWQADRMIAFGPFLALGFWLVWLGLTFVGI